MSCTRAMTFKARAIHKNSKKEPFGVPFLVIPATLKKYFFILPSKNVSLIVKKM